MRLSYFVFLLISLFLQVCQAMENDNPPSADSEQDFFSRSMIVVDPAKSTLELVETFDGAFQDDYLMRKEEAQKEASFLYGGQVLEARQQAENTLRRVGPTLKPQEYALMTQRTTQEIAKLPVNAPHPSVVTPKLDKVGQAWDAERNRLERDRQHSEAQKIDAERKRQQKEACQREAEAIAARQLAKRDQAMNQQKPSVPPAPMPVVVSPQNETQETSTLTHSDPQDEQTHTAPLPGAQEPTQPTELSGNVKIEEVSSPLNLPSSTEVQRDSTEDNGVGVFSVSQRQQLGLTNRQSNIAPDNQSSDTPTTSTATADKAALSQSTFSWAPIVGGAAGVGVAEVLQYSFNQPLNKAGYRFGAQVATFTTKTFGVKPERLQSLPRFMSGVFHLAGDMVGFCLGFAVTKYVTSY